MFGENHQHDEGRDRSWVAGLLVKISREFSTSMAGMNHEWDRFGLHLRSIKFWSSATLAHQLHEQKEAAGKSTTFCGHEFSEEHVSWAWPIVTIFFNIPPWGFGAKMPWRTQGRVCDAGVEDSQRLGLGSPVKFINDLKVRQHRLHHAKTKKSSKKGFCNKNEPAKAV